MSELLLGDRQIWAALLSVDGIGRGTFLNVERKLKYLKKDWSEFWWACSASLWSECGLYEYQQQALAEFQRQYTPEGYYGWLREQNIGVLVHTDRKYPILLKKC